MIKIIEAMYDLANEEDRTGEKSPDKRVDLIMERLNKNKDGKEKKKKYCFSRIKFFSPSNRSCSSQ
jgi:hypothetical protein